MRKHIEALKQKILPILYRYNIKKAGLFGSCVRGEMSEVLRHRYFSRN